LQFLEQEISPFSKYVPRMLAVIRTALYWHDAILYIILNRFELD
jgi:hypothetical protein